MIEEIWKTIPFEPKYLVSTHGRVKRKGYGILTGGPSNRMYWRYAINKKEYNGHRLVAMTFIPNPNDLPVVKHIDGDGFNNKVTNLKWCEYSENNTDTRKHGRHRRANESLFGKCHEV